MMMMIKKGNTLIAGIFSKIEGKKRKKRESCAQRSETEKVRQIKKI